ncbi:stage III sporulation protein AA [Pseudalkalibacillus caeni]|uniref:Stage III sporulation protein AA n=1 Tax=Exobacillus caeni TaxID=2574798 RepID=A0A5R9F9I2_9BACL|nr:stage III sporulation protein AA [Pseudalkalibacillus caeni]TLS36365.1 stage III sporulation protein AA [Pseudalkalibacillus caeni]
MKEILDVLPDTIRRVIEQMDTDIKKGIEEIRIRILRPLEIIVDGKSIIPDSDGGKHVITPQESGQLLNKLSQYSLYALEEELKRGYITIQGGHRVGLAGKVITEKGQVKAIKHIASFNIRVAKQKVGIADRFVPYLYDGKWLNTILIGPPQTGKTTLLRDLARIISTGDIARKLPSFKVGIVDERSEIAGCVNGVPQHHLGDRIDVLDACPKAEGMMMMIRSMSPDVLVVDEIGRKEDSEAILEAVNAGIQIIMTMHGNTMEDLFRRPSIRPLLDMGVFDRMIELTRANGPGTINRIRNQHGKEVYCKKVI